MGNISVKFSGDPQQLLQAYQQIHAANVKLQEQMANTARQSKRDRNAVTDHIAGEIKSLKALGTSYLTVSSAVGQVTRAYDDWRQRVEGIAAKAKEANQELVSTIVLAGQAANAAEIAGRLSSIPGMSGGQARAMFEGLAGGASNQVSHDRLLNLTAASAPLAALGIDLKTFGTFVGDLANHETQAAPDVLVARAMQIFSQPGAEKLVQAKMAGPIRKLVAAGMPQNEAWALALEANNKGVPGLVGQLAGLVVEPYDAPDTRGRTRLTPEEAGKARLAAASTPEARRALLTSDRDVARAVGLDAAGLDLLDPGAMATSAQQLASGRGTPREILASLAGTKQGRSVIEGHMASLKTGLTDRALSEVAKDYAIAEEMWEGYTKPFDWFTRLSANTTRNLYGAFGITNPAASLWAASPELIQEFIDRRNREAGYERFVPFADAPTLTEEGTRRDAAAAAEVVKQTELLRKILDSLTGGRSGAAPVTNLNEP